jgi:hypothetical protein
MPRYLVERRFPEGVQIPVDRPDEHSGQVVVQHNSQEGVTWLHSYVSAEKRRSYCLCDGPTPEAIRRAASRNKLPIHEITEVRVLNPYPFTYERETS